MFTVYVPDKVPKYTDTILGTITCISTKRSTGQGRIAPTIF